VTFGFFRIGVLATIGGGCTTAGVMSSGGAGRRTLGFLGGGSVNGGAYAVVVTF
jgi:hypothetical protein